MSTELFSLAGRTALVTGSSRGLGNAIAEGFAAALIRLYEDATLWQKLSDNGYKHIARHFTPEVVGETVSQSIISLASDRE